MNEEKNNPVEIARRIVAELNAQSDNEHRSEADWEAVDEVATAEAAKVYPETDDARADALREEIKSHICLTFPYETAEEKHLSGAAPQLLAAAREVLANWERGDLAAAVRALQAVVDDFDEQSKTGFLLWNATDGIFASPENFATRADAEAFAVKFRKRFDRQGFYRDIRGQHLDPQDVILRAVPACP